MVFMLKFVQFLRLESFCNLDLTIERYLLTGKFVNKVTTSDLTALLKENMSYDSIHNIKYNDT